MQLLNNISRLVRAGFFMAIPVSVFVLVSAFRYKGIFLDTNKFTKELIE
jgi:hypothetical protein